MVVRTNHILTINIFDIIFCVVDTGKVIVKYPDLLYIDLLKERIIAKKVKLEMRKVTLRMNEVHKYKTIKKLIDTDGNKKAAALKLSCSTHTINRLIQVYKTDFKFGFVHSNRNRKPSTTIDDSIKQTFIDLFRTIYYDANLIHFQELLQKHHDISVSRNIISKWLYEYDLIFIKAHRKTKRLLTKKLKKK